MNYASQTKLVSPLALNVAVVLIVILIVIAMSRLFAAALAVLVAKGRCSGEEVSPGTDRLCFL